MAGWLNRKQQAVIEYLLEENRVLKEQFDHTVKKLRLKISRNKTKSLLISMQPSLLGIEFYFLLIQFMPKSSSRTPEPHFPSSVTQTGLNQF